MGQVSDPRFPLISRVIVKTGSLSPDPKVLKPLGAFSNGNSPLKITALDNKLIPGTGIAADLL